MRFLRAMVIVSILTGCVGNTTGPDASSETASFSLSASGTQEVTMTGIALHPGIMTDGFRESTLAQSSIVDPIVLVEGLPPRGAAMAVFAPFTGPQLFIGVLGTATAGTYSVHRFGTRLGERPEVYGTFMVRLADGGSRRFDLSEGTLTIQAVRPVLRGVFSFRSNSYGDWPANPQPGTTVTGQQGNLTITGSFGPPNR